MLKFMPFTLVLVVGLGGCASQVPIASTYPYSVQQKMQAIHHWDVLAADVVEQIQATSSELGPLYVQQAAEMPFDQAFHDLIITRLVNSGYTVLEHPRSDAARLSYRAQLVKHGDRGYIRSRAGTFTALMGGVLVARDLALYSTSNEAIGATAIGLGVATDVFSGLITHLTDTEVLITTSIMRHGQYMARQSNIYYIPPDNSAHYQSGAEVSTRVMGVVNE